MKQYNLTIEAQSEAAARQMGKGMEYFLSLTGTSWNFELIHNETADGLYKFLVTEGGPPNDREAKAFC